VAPLRLQRGDDLASVVPPASLIWVSGCSAESNVLADLVRTSSALGEAVFTGIFVAGLNREPWASNRQSRARSYFLTPPLKALAERCEFLPLPYTDIGAHLMAAPPQAALVTVSPPDEEGRCSLGTCVDFIADLWPHIPVRIAHINPSMPRTAGDTGIPFRSLSAWIEEDDPLLEMADELGDDVAQRIGGLVAEYVTDGATLQTGLGKIPGAVLRALTGHRDLAIYSGLIGDPVIDLLNAGALRADGPITAGVAIGSRRLYDAVGREAFDFRPPSVTHDVRRLASIEQLVSINSALEVDLFGQAYAEMGPRGFMSGPGGASEFARGAKLSCGGLRILVLPSVSGGASRIIMPPGRGPVSLGRMDTDLVVTEHGVADLRYSSHDARAQALIAIAAPEERDNLAQSWAAFSKENR
jgi:acyl-CoA hydrolase